MTINLVTIFYPLCYNGQHGHILIRVHQVICEDYVRVLGISLDPTVDAMIDHIDRMRIQAVIHQLGTKKFDHGFIIPNQGV